MSKAILVLDLEHPNENIDIEGTQVTYIELKTKKGIRRISLIGHWLKPLPERINPLKVGSDSLLDLGYLHGRNDLINQLESDENE